MLWKNYLDGLLKSTDFWTLLLDTVVYVPKWAQEIRILTIISGFSDTILLWIAFEKNCPKEILQLKIMYNKWINWGGKKPVYESIPQLKLFMWHLDFLMKN